MLQMSLWHLYHKKTTPQVNCFYYTIQYTINKSRNSRILWKKEDSVERYCNYVQSVKYSTPNVSVLLIPDNVTAGPPSLLGL